MRAGILAILLISAQATAEDLRRDVPQEIFGVPLGAVVRLDPEDKHRLIGLEGIHIAGKETFVLPGWHVYFRPSREYSGFPYVRHHNLGSEGGYSASFHLRLLPLLPESTEDLAVLARSDNLETSVDYEIISVEWRGFKWEQTESPYWWAFDLCQAFALDFKVEPEVTDRVGDVSWFYECKFTQGRHEFAVTGNSYGTFKQSQISLKFSREVRAEKHERFQERRKRFRLESVRPY